MCDTDTVRDNERLSRREFALGASAASLATLLPAPADALPVTGHAVEIAAGDGKAQAYFAAPTTGTHPAVLVWPDIFGLRPAFEGMAARLARSGYAVLAVNQFYRSTRTPFAGPPDAMSRAMGWRKLLTPEATTRDALAFAHWLDAQPQVATRRGMASTGYCMGGPMTFLTAAALPKRVTRIGTFHGGGLVTDAPDSPHRLVPRLNPRLHALLAIAQNDDAKAPGDKDALKAAFAAAKRPAEIAVYPANHGWCPPDSPAYDQVQAERAWARQLVLLRTL